MAGNLVMVQSFAEKMISVVIVKSATKLKQQKHQGLGLHGGGNLLGDKYERTRIRTVPTLRATGRTS